MLSENQINRLYKFCTQHYVRYYDVQVELVDHLANAVEEKLEADENLDFETALENVYIGFGKTGFSRIVSQKTKALNKEYLKRRWNYFGEFFTLPKIIFIIFLAVVFTVLYFIIGKKNISTLGLSISILLFLTALTFIIFSVVKYKSPKKELLCTKDRWSILMPISLAAQLPNYFFLIFGGRKHAQQIFVHNPVWYFVVAFFFIFLIILSLAAIKVYIEIEEDARKNYPLAFEN